MKVYYARVSHKSQNIERQLEEAKKLEITKIFQEKKSGKNIKDRQELQKCLDFLHEEDELYINSLDRLSRDYDDIKWVINQLNDKKVKLTVLDAPFLNFDSGNELMDKMMFDLFINILSYVANQERLKNRERQAQGIKLAKSQGKYRGRKMKYHANATGANKLVYDKMIEMLNQGYSYNEISKSLKIGRSTIYRAAKKQKEEGGL